MNHGPFSAILRSLEQAKAWLLFPLRVCAVKRRHFPVGFNSTRPWLQPEAAGAVMEVTI
jgi:hypothetical protein